MRSGYVFGLLLGVCLLLMIGDSAADGSTGQIKGRVIDKESGEPLFAASVQILGAKTGAMTDEDGKYAILKDPIGEYNLKISHIDYTTVEIAGVQVNAELTTEQDVQMTRRVGDLDKTIKCTADRDIIKKHITGSQQIVDQKAISTRPVQDVDALLQQVEGVKTNSSGEVYIRGGRAGEVSYIIDGVNIGDPLGCQSSPLPHGGTDPVNGVPYSEMFFKHYGVNPFVDTEDDHLSTFAIDVDDASFAMARSYLDRGHLPPSEAVRTEEFVNHFDYDYQPPEHGAIAVHVDGAPSRFGGSNIWLLRIGIQGYEVAPENRRAANLVFVVDVSGSMSYENRLALVRKALKLQVEELRDDDQVGIVVYGSRGRVLLRPTSIRKKTAILDAIAGLVPEGATNAEEGLRLGYEMADKMFEAEKINRIVLCSDGVANVGCAGPDEILKQIKQYADKGITLSAVGFGMGNYNDIFMERLGNSGDGHYAYVDELPAARKVFVENLTGTLQVIARDVKVQVEFAPEAVRSYRLIGFENRDVADRDFRANTVDGGELGAGHTVTALYEIKLATDSLRSRIGRVLVCYKNRDRSAVSELSKDIRAEEFHSTFRTAPRNLRLAGTAAEFAEILRKSYWARTGNLKDVLAEASYLYAESESSEALELIEPVSKASRLTEELASK